MNCKQCENEIKEDSKFCSFCGVRTDANAESIKGNPLIKDSIDALEIKDANPIYISKEKGYYIAGLVFFGLYILKLLFDSLLMTVLIPYPIIGYFQTCLNLGAASIPILLSKYTTSKEHKNFLQIIGLMLFIIGICRNGMSLPFGLGIIFYATPYVLFIALLRKANSKTWLEIFIGFMASTLYGIVLVLATMGGVVENDYFGVAHLAILSSYPIVNLIIGLIYGIKMRFSNKS